MEQEEDSEGGSSSPYIIQVQDVTPTPSTGHHATVEEPVDRIHNDSAQNQALTVRIAMTLLLACLVLAVLLTFWIVPPQYAFLLVMLWTLLITLFVGFAYFVQTDILTRRNGPIYPYLAHAARIIQQEIDDFRDDWKDEVLLLTYNEETPHAKNATMTLKESPNAPRKPKSLLFRTFVRPLIALRRQRKRKAPKAATSPEYQPPTQGVVV